MNKKIYILIGAVLVVGIVLFLIFYKSGNRSTTVSNSSNQGENLDTNYNKQTGEVQSVDAATGNKKTVATVASGLDPISVQISPDKKAVLTAVEQFSDSQIVTGNSEAEKFMINQDSTNSITISDAFSPVWLDNGLVAYQKLPPSGNFEVVLYDSINNKQTKSFSLTSGQLLDLQKINSTTILASDFVTDAGEVKARIVNIVDGSVKDLISGDNFQFKAVADSKYVALEEPSGSDSSVSIINWSTSETVAEMQTSLEGVDWLDTNNFAIFVRDAGLFKFDLSTKKEINLNKSVSGTVRAVKIIDASTVLVSTDQGDSRVKF